MSESPMDKAKRFSNTLSEGLNDLAVLALPRFLKHALSLQTEESLRASLLKAVGELVDACRELGDESARATQAFALHRVPGPGAHLVELLREQPLDSPELRLAARAVYEATGVIPSDGWSRMEAWSEDQLLRLRMPR